MYDLIMMMMIMLVMKSGEHTEDDDVNKYSLHEMRHIKWV